MKKNIGKRILSLALALVMMAGWMPHMATEAHAAAPITLSDNTFSDPGNGFYFQISALCGAADCDVSVTFNSQSGTTTKSNENHSFTVTSFSYNISAGKATWSYSCSYTTCQGSGTFTYTLSDRAFTCTDKLYIGPSVRTSDKRMYVGVYLCRPRSAHQGDATCVTSANCTLCGTSYKTDHIYNTIPTGNGLKHYHPCMTEDCTAKYEEKTYTQGDHAIIETCNFSGCDRALTITLPEITESYTYTGSEFRPLGNEDVVYSIGGNTIAFDTIPADDRVPVQYENNANAGTAKAYITKGGVRAERPFTINPASIAGATVELQSISEKYTGGDLTPTVAVTYSGTQLTEHTDYEISWHPANVVDVGTYQIKIKGKGNFKDEATLNQTFAITRATPTAANFVLTPPTSLTYDGGEKKATVAVAEGIVGMGSVTAVHYFNSAGAEVETPTAVDTYTVKVDVAEGGNYEAITGLAVGSFTIEKATPTFTDPTAKELTYKGEPLTLVEAGSVNPGKLLYSLDGGEYSETVPTATNAGNYTVYYKVVDLDTDNYNEISSGSVPVTIRKAEAPDITFPEVLNEITYGQKLEEAKLSFYENDYGTFNWNAPTAYPGEAGTISCALDFYPNELALQNYDWKDAGNAQWIASRNALCICPDVTVNKAASTITTAPTANDLTYNGGALALVTEGTVIGGTMQYKLGEDGEWSTEVPSATNATTYTVYYQIVGDSNHLDMEAKSVTVTIKKADYDMTAAKWDYTSAFQYDGLEHTVTVTGLPSGVTVKKYSGNSASVVGDYTAKVTFTYDEDNYNTPVLADLTWAIENNWNPTEYTTNGSEWKNTDFVITAKDGYLLSTTNTADGTWVDSFTGSTEGEHGITFYVKNTTTGAISLAVTESYKLDKTAPTGTVSIDENKWSDLWNTITFGLFFKETKTVKVEVATDLSGIAKVEYYDSATALSADAVKAVTAWTDMGADYAQNVTAEDAKTFIYYIRITDNAGNVTYISTADATYDLTKPAISGITDGSTYYTTQKVTVTDTNLDSVTLNGETVTDEITLAGNVDKTYTIVATDKAGNETKFTVTMKPIASISAPIDSIDETNVNSGNTDAIAEVEAAAAAVDTANATDAEKAAIKAITDKCDALQEVIADTAAEYERITDAIAAYDPDEVTSADKAELDKLAEDLKALAESGNLTDSEKAALETPTENLDAMIETVKEVTEESDRIADAVGDYDLETVKSSDKDEIEQLVKDIDALLDTDNLTDEERTALEGEKTKCENLLAKIEGTDALVDKLTEDVGAYDEDTVKSTDKAALEQLVEDIEAVIEGNTNITEEEKAELEALVDTVEDLLAKIEEVAQAPVTEDTEKVEDITSENVTPEDKEDLEKAKADLEDALTENAGNYTDSEKKAIQEKIDRIDDALEAIENVESVEETISELPAIDTVEPDDEGAIKAITDAKAEYDALTDHEKSLVSEDTKKKLDDLCAALVAYDIIKGEDGKYTQGGSKGLSFTANGAYSKFTGILVDNKVVDSKHYTAESGSTIITLKASYLDTLSTGKHTLTVVYTDGETSCEFNIAAKSTTPATGDDSNIMLYGSMFTVSLAAIIVLLLASKKRKQVS